MNIFPFPVRDKSTTVFPANDPNGVAGMIGQCVTVAMHRTHYAALERLGDLRVPDTTLGHDFFNHMRHTHGDDIAGWAEERGAAATMWQGHIGIALVDERVAGWVCDLPKEYFEQVIASYINDALIPNLEMFIETFTADQNTLA